MSVTFFLLKKVHPIPLPIGNQQFAFYCLEGEEVVEDDFLLDNAAVHVWHDSEGGNHR